MSGTVWGVVSLLARHGGNGYNLVRLDSPSSEPDFIVRRRMVESRDMVRSKGRVEQGGSNASPRIGPTSLSAASIPVGGA